MAAEEVRPKPVDPSLCRSPDSLPCQVVGRWIQGKTEDCAGLVDSSWACALAGTAVPASNRATPTEPRSSLLSRFIGRPHGLGHPGPSSDGPRRRAAV